MTSKSIAGIAILTGFSDQSHLTRGFKRRFDATPSQFRLNSQLRANGLASEVKG